MRHSVDGAATVSQNVNSVTAPPPEHAPSSPAGETALEERSAIVATGDASDPAFWRDLFEERAAILQYDGTRSRAEAEQLAWGELQNRWHLAHHGERVPRHLCAGCRRPIDEAPALDLIDGCRVHDAAGHDCVIRWGERWRGAATRALVAMGLPAATGTER
jgi:hypothetical protein